MTFRLIFAALIFSMTMTTGCSQTMNTADAGSVKAKLNPHPQQRYELTFTIHDAPGPFEPIVASIHYEVGNEECVPTDTISGAKSKTPNLLLSVPLIRVSENIYRGEIALDLPIDEDYFGLGVCHWMDAGAGVNLKSHGVSFGAGIAQAEIEAQKTIPTYFWKEHYFGVSVEGFADPGATYENYSKMPDKEKYFYVDVAAKRMRL